MGSNLANCPFRINMLFRNLKYNNLVELLRKLIDSGMVGSKTSQGLKFAAVSLVETQRLFFSFRLRICLENTFDLTFFGSLKVAAQSKKGYCVSPFVIY